MAADRIEGFAAEVTELDDHVVVVVHGEIDMSTAETFRDILDAATRRRNRVEIDLRDLTFMDSTALAVLVTAYRRLGQAHEAIVLRDPPRRVRMLLELSGVTELVDVRSDGHASVGASSPGCAQPIPGLTAGSG